MLELRINTFVVGLCKFVGIIDLLVICLNPHPEAPACLSTLEVLQAKECTPIPSVMFAFGLVVESIKEFGDALGWVLYKWFCCDALAIFY